MSRFISAHKVKFIVVAQKKASRKIEIAKKWQKLSARFPKRKKKTYKERSSHRRPVGRSRDVCGLNLPSDPESKVRC